MPPPTDPAAPAATFRTLLTNARQRLGAAAHAPSPREAYLLLGHLLGWSEAQVLAREHLVTPPGVATNFEALLLRRLAGEPMAYVLGEREFYGRTFRVDHRVLIPRPETEHLVEAALGLELPEAARVLDIGAGSGAIAVTLALERPRWRVCATDLSPAALAAARANATALGARVGLLATDLTRGLDLGTFDLVVSNPPYVSRRDTVAPEVAEHEPALALYADDHAAGPGTAVYARLLAELAALRSGTPVVLEIGFGQLGALAALAAGYPTAGFELMATVEDYAAIPRVVVLRRR